MAALTWLLSEIGTKVCPRQQKFCAAQLRWQGQPSSCKVLREKVGNSLGSFQTSHSESPQWAPLQCILLQMHRFTHVALIQKKNQYLILAYCTSHILPFPSYPLSLKITMSFYPLYPHSGMLKGWRERKGSGKTKRNIPCLYPTPAFSKDLLQSCWDEHIYQFPVASWSSSRYSMPNFPQTFFFFLSHKLISFWYHFPIF